MHLLKHEVATFEACFPGLDAELAAMGLETLEQPNGTALAILRERGISKLLIDRNDGGSGVTPLEFVRIQTALGRRVPSVSIGSCMHHFKLAALISEAKHNPIAERILRRLLREDRLLLASGSAEGKLGQSLYKPSVSLSGTKDKLFLNGAKRPCSLSQSMTHLSGMATGAKESPYPDQLMHYFIVADQPGVRSRLFWKNPVLLAAESHEVIMEDAIVDPEMLLPLGTAALGSSFSYACYGWFELSACAVYTGILAALVETIVDTVKPAQSDLGRWAVALGQLQELIRGIASELESRPFDEDLVSRMFRIRFAAETVITETALDCFSFIGGVGYGVTTLPMTLMNICLALQFHPPRRHNMIGNLGAEVFSGKIRLA